MCIRDRYKISKPSQGIDGVLQMNFTPHRELTMYLNYRYKRKERDVTGTNGEITLPTYHHRLRYRLNYSPDDLFSLRTTVDYNNFHSSGGSSRTGLSDYTNDSLPFIPYPAKG